MRLERREKMTLTRMNGKTFEVDALKVTDIKARKDGGSTLTIKGHAGMTQCRENVIQVAQLMNAQVKEVAQR